MELAREISGPVAVIGDVHGQVHQLECVLQQLKALPDYERRWIVFIGDLVDRGPNPQGSMELVLETLRDHERTTVVCGNHEYAMAAALKFVDTPEYCDWANRWLDHYGCQTTFRSYGVQNYTNLAELRDAVPDAHRDLLSDLPWCVEHPEYFFVHAGLDPSTPFALQRDILRDRDLTLTRPQWLCSKSLTFQNPPRDCTSVVVSGHVRVPKVTFGPKRLLIDTTGGESGPLSCVLLPENQIIHSDLDRAPEFTVWPTNDGAAPKKKRGWFW
ncbi:metallophosphoesterase [Planctomicrobium sp. SH668]|uniref:metallophosphoesterase n=1 Tax=Planctomicrobium sp. SH668 TaxID=3448126 RepID=UPI003F5C7D70